MPLPSHVRPFDSRTDAPGSRSIGDLLAELGQQAKSFPRSVLRIAGRDRSGAGTPLAIRAFAMPPPMRRSPDLTLALRGLGLFVLFVGGAWATLRLTSATHVGLVLGPLAAQVTMAAVLLVGSRFALRGCPAPERSLPTRRVRVAPLVLIACGGFLFQASVLAGTRVWAASSLSGAAAAGDPRLAWLVMLASSVVAAPLLEELFFRGMLQPLLSRRNVALGLIATAALFGAAHAYGMPLRAVPAFLQGLVLGGLTLLTGRLRGAVVVHAINNALVLAATTLVAVQPAHLAAVRPGGGAWILSGYALLGLGLLAWGFARVAREPRIQRPLIQAS
jgi:membrane protease YdiL (CAAX protease family)